MRRAVLWGPPLAYMALIFYSSSQPDPAPALTSFVWDKALHASGYALLAVLMCRALRGERLPLRVAVVLAALLTSTYGASDEWHQAFTPMRSPEVRDWAADTVGGVAGAAVYAFTEISTALHQRRRPRRSPPGR
jgi:VanZ family protein